MDIRLLDALRNAPSLDLYELSLALHRMLDDPRRILEVRRHLHLGAQVMYFDHRRGTLAPGRVMQLQPTSATVQDDITRTQWKLPYAAIVADPAQRAQQEPPAPQRRSDVTAFKLGDTVSFTDKHLCEHIGTPSPASTPKPAPCSLMASSGGFHRECCTRSSIFKKRDSTVKPTGEHQQSQ